MDGLPPHHHRPHPRFRPPLHTLPLPFPLLLLPPLLLFIATLTTHITTLLHDPNIPFLLSQCHAHARLPLLTTSPLLPDFVSTPLCFLTTLLQTAAGSASASASGSGSGAGAGSGSPETASLRAGATLAPILAAIAALVTITTLESARVCNTPARLLKHPTALWAVFQLLGGPAMGALVWQVGFVPAFLRRGRGVVVERNGGRLGDHHHHPVLGDGMGMGMGMMGMRHVRVRAEGWAVPVAVGVGFVVPAVVMLVVDSAVAVGVWLLFPVWVSVVRRVVRGLVVVVLGREKWGGSVHLERSWSAVVGVYAVPVLCSVLAHAYLVWSLTQPDDRREMTRSTLKLITTDAFFLGLTVLYWVFMEAGWRAALVMVGISAALGPGAGICAAWIYRERAVDLDRSVTVVAVGSRRPSEDADPSEQTPLLR
ncbi:uncharacterized protein B0H64DRAFT_477945 [Chaetomium fimeti]|uniref:Uncharacterized protein n=1 Tax=Chaetomium fimeti TaxID=1854472 RepID=A0AAE0LP25_9PEZI|nr:hypothetical protein B0H64DRAFT_477945 [Chaetomium fimeti]